MFEPEILIGIVFLAAVAAVVVYDRIGNGKLGFKLPLKKKDKDVEEKMKEIDEKLEEVVSSGVSEKVEKFVPLDEAAKNVEVQDNLLEEMQMTNISKNDGGEEEKVPDLPELPELPEDTNSDLEVNTEEIDKEFSLESEDESDESESREEEEEKVEFDEEDELIASIAKEVETKEEEEIDLLRDLKGQEFDVHELERELSEVLQKLRAMT